MDRYQNVPLSQIAFDHIARAEFSESMEVQTAQQEERFRNNVIHARAQICEARVECIDGQILEDLVE